MVPPDPTTLTAELVIETEGWHPRYARVVLIAADDDVGVVLVDGNGDGSELEMEYWTHDGDAWVGGSSSGYGSLDSVSTVTWDAGPMVCAIGRGSAGEIAQVRYDGEVFDCIVNEFGLWGFERKTEEMFTGELPEVEGMPDDHAQQMRHLDDRRRQLRERVERLVRGEEPRTPEE